jgi:hypothetical protein
MLDDVGLFIPGQMYDTIYSNNKQHLDIILLSSIINTETYDLMVNPVENTTLYMYFDNFNLSLFENVSKLPHVRILLKDDQDLPTIKKPLNKKQLIKIPYLYSETILNQSLSNSNRYENIDISASIANLDKIPASISDLLFPNEPLLNIKLFGNGREQMDTPNNVGLVTDGNMLDIIKSSNLYIDLNKIYLSYALLMDIPTLSVIENNKIAKTKLTRESLLSVKKPSEMINLADIHKQSYKYFFKEKVL